jgi:hypothetical protein
MTPIERLNWFVLYTISLKNKILPNIPYIVAPPFFIYLEKKSLAKQFYVLTNQISFFFQLDFYVA